MHKPAEVHYQAVKRILHYVKSTIDYRIRILLQFMRAWCPTTRKSTTGYCVYLGSNWISWAAWVSFQGLHYYRTYILHDVGFPLDKSPVLFCDNLSSLYMIANPDSHARTKYIEIYYHFVREKVALGVLITKFVALGIQNAYILITKPFAKEAYRLLRPKLGVLPAPHSSLRGNDKKEEMGHHANEVDQHMSCTSSGQNQQIRHPCQ